MRFATLALTAVLLVHAATGLASTTCKKNPDCNDGNPCTIDKCDKPTRTCKYTPVNNGTTCNDSDPCTQTDTCQAGVCTGANPKSCPAIDPCHGAGSCDPGTGACSAPPLADGTACTDYNHCTQTDECQAGVCVGGNPLACAAADACHLAGTCEPTTGVCSNPPVDPNTCAALDQCHVLGVCNVDFSCTITPKSDGVACNDGDACTQTDQCTAGNCVGGNPVACASDDPCVTGGTCDSLTGICNGGPVADGTVCDSGTATTCSAPDTCQGGSCVVGGGGDQDADGVCDADDDCPTMPDAGQADLDGDGIGDVCDDADAALTLKRVAIKLAKPTGAANGHLILRGSMASTPPIDAIGQTDGLAIHVVDAASLVVDDDFAPGECKTAANGVHCKKAGDASTQAKLRGKPGASTVKLAIRLGGVAVDLAPTAPLTVTLTTGAVDRVGTAASCSTGAGGARCALAAPR